jgi:hypothetical protein
VVALAGLLAVLVLVGVAYAAEHNYANYRHGITDEGWNTAHTIKWYRAKTTDIDGNQEVSAIWAYGYHYASTGEWQEKCGQYSPNSFFQFCDFDPGNYPCRKYAWSAGDRPAGPDLTWHGHNPAFC